MNNKLIKFAFEYVTKFSDNRHEDQEAFLRNTGKNRDLAQALYRAILAA